MQPQQSYPQTQNPINYPQTPAYFGQQPMGYPGGPVPNYTPQPPKKPKNQTVQKILNWVKKRWYFALPIALIIVLILAASAFFLLQSNGSGSIVRFNKVKTEIIAPEELPQGTPGVWEVVIENQESVPLRDIIVDLQFDSDFEFTREISPSPENVEGTRYKISRLDEAGGRSPSAKIRLEGILIGNPDVETQMSGKISYLPDTNMASLSELEILPVKTKIRSPRVEVVLSPSQETVANGGEAEFTVVLKNLIDSDYRDLRLRMLYPSGSQTFTYTSSEFSLSNTGAPQSTPSEGDDIWLIPRLPGRGEQTLKLRGRVFAGNNARLTFGVELALKNDSNEYQKIFERFKDIQVTAQPILLNSEFIGKENSLIVRPGESLNVRVSFENSGQQTLNNVQILAFIDDPANILDLSTLSFGSGERGDIVGNNVQWIPTRIPQLATLRPGQKGQLSYSVKVKELDKFLNVNLDQTQYTLRPGSQAKGQNLEQIENTGKLYKGKGELEFIQEEPVLLGTNPGNGNDIYAISWKIKTWQNQLTDVRVTATSPLQAGAWINKIEPISQAGNLEYNQTNGEILWRVGQVEAYAGRGKPEVVVTFQVEVKKNSKEVVLRNTKSEGLDVFTSEKYETEIDNLQIR